MSYPPNLAIGTLVESETLRVKTVLNPDLGNGFGSYELELVDDDLTLKFIIAENNPNEPGVTWLDSATATAFPAAKQNDLIRNDSVNSVTLGGTAIAPKETYRNNAVGWEKWGGVSEEIAIALGRQSSDTATGSSNAGIAWDSGIDGYEFWFSGSGDSELYCRNTTKTVLVQGYTRYEVGTSKNIENSAFTITSGNRRIWSDGSLNFTTAGSKQWFRFTDVETNTEYEIEGTLGAGYNNNQFIFRKF